MNNTIGIINYGLGNLHSVAGAVERLEHQPLISSNPDELASCAKLILPGVGAFGKGMQNLRECGLIDPLTGIVIQQKKPVLGICLGFQLLCKQSEEFGTHEGLGWLDADVKRINTAGKDLRLPHVGWNDLEQTADSILFQDIPTEALFYYVHTYCVKPNQPGLSVGECEYGERFTAVMQQDNIFGTQFHPEKSQWWGLKLLENYLKS